MSKKKYWKKSEEQVAEVVDGIQENPEQAIAAHDSDDRILTVQPASKSKKPAKQKSSGKSQIQNHDKFAKFKKGAK